MAKKRRKMTPAQAAAARYDDDSKKGAASTAKADDNRGYGLTKRDLFFRLVLPLLCIAVVVAVGYALHIAR